MTKDERERLGRLRGEHGSLASLVTMIHSNWYVHGRDLLAPCPLCQPSESDPERFKLRLALGDVPGKLLLLCRRCGPERTADILRHYDLDLSVLTQPPEELAEWWAERVEDVGEQVYTLADADLRDNVYREFLSLLGGDNPPPYPELPPAEDVRSRYASALWERYGDDLFRVPGFSNVDGGVALTGVPNKPAYLIPCRTLDGKIAAVKARLTKSKHNKMRTLTSRSHQGPKGEAICHAPLGSPRRSKSVRVVEGERKADVVFEKTGEPTVSIPGVGAWRRAVPVLREMGCQLVVLALDQDDAGRKAAVSIIPKLADEGFAVDVEEWPEEHKGPDDAVTAGLKLARFKAEEVWDRLVAEASPVVTFIVASSDFGRPVSLLMKEVFPPLRWAVPDMIPEGLTILAGKSKQGKSWLALDLALAISTGTPALGSIAVTPGRVLYLGLEDSPRRMQSRVGHLLRVSGRSSEMSVTGLHFIGRTEKFPRLDKGGLTYLTGWMKDYPDTRMIVLDTLAKVQPMSDRAGSYLTDYALLSTLSELALEHQVAVLCLTHTRKTPADDPLDSVLGSTGMVAEPDGVLVLRRERGSAEAKLWVSCKETDDRWDHLMWDADTKLWSVTGRSETLDDEPRQAGSRGRADRCKAAILRLLSPDGMGAAALADALLADGHENQAIKTARGELSKEGRIRQRGRKHTLRWEIVNPPVVGIGCQAPVESGGADSIRHGDGVDRGASPHPEASAGDSV